MNLEKTDKILVTCGLPYTNGPAHLGHLRTYIPGDAYTRYLKHFGYDVIFVCGSDTHGAPTEVAAREEGVSTKELVSKYHKHFKSIFEKMQIGVDFFGSTEEPYHYRRAQSIIQTLEDKGYIEIREVQLPYCPKCKSFLADRFLVGTCPYCGAEARGDECDQGCQRYLDADQLIDPRCAICGTPAEKRTTRHHFLKLPIFTDFLIAFNEQLKGTPIARNYALGWIRQGLKDWCISRNLKWGIPYPGDEDLTLYVWAENYAGYISFTEELARQTGRDWEAYWKRDGKLVHFIGADIVYHHAVFWPAILKGAEYNTPWAIVASGMLKIEGYVFSKSRGFVTYIEEDYIRNDIDLDALRYYMLSYTGHTKDLDFVWKDFQTKVNNELVGILGNFAYRALLFNFKNFGKIPQGELSDTIKVEIEKAIENVRKAIADFRFKEAADAAMQLATYGNVTFQQCEPWKYIKEDSTRCQADLYDCLQLLKAISILIEPVMPTIAEQLWQQLGQSGDVHRVPVEECLVPIRPGTPLTKPKLLFAKIPDEDIEKMTKILNERIKKAIAKSSIS
ncbi:MAG: methionine--tRNA ligase [Promethearchaeota archaeon]